MLKLILDKVGVIPFWLIALGMATGGAAAITLSLLLLDVTFDYTLQSVLFGSIVLGIVTAVLGSFLTLRRQSLVADVLAHAALPGVVLAFLIGGGSFTVLFLGATVAGWLGLVGVAVILNTTRLKEDSALGIVLATFFGFGVSLLSYSQGREDAGRAGLNRFFFGQAATIVGTDVIIIAGLAVVVLMVVIGFWKELQLVTFDAEFATTNGYPIRIYNFLLSALVVTTVMMGLPIAGVILMVGMLIAPAVAARQWTNDFREMTLLAAIYGAIGGGLGAIASSVGWGRPTGPMIIGLVSFIAFSSLVIAPVRGLLWQWLRRWQDRGQLAVDNLLGDLYRFAQHSNQNDLAVPQSTLVHVRGVFAYFGLQELQRKGFVTFHADKKWSLTPSGFAFAESEAQKRRYWELYRMYQHEMPKVEIDYRKDVRELLPPQALELLQQKLD